MVGLGRFELPTSRLSGVRSDQLSYRPSQPGSWRTGSEKLLGVNTLTQWPLLKLEPLLHQT